MTWKSALMVTSASSVRKARSCDCRYSTAACASSSLLCLARSAMSPPPIRSQVPQPSALLRLSRISSAVARALCPAADASPSSRSWLSK